MSFLDRVFGKRGFSERYPSGPLGRKAKALTFGLLSGASIFARSIFKELEKSTVLSQQQKDEIEFAVSYVLLLKTQEYFYEHVIPDDREAALFEELLFRAFGQAYKVDPRPFVLDFAKYWVERRPSDQLQYLGRKVCDIIGTESIRLVIDIAVMMAHYIGPLYETCDSAWGYDNVKLADIEAEFDRLCSQ